MKRIITVSLILIFVFQIRCIATQTHELVIDTGDINSAISNILEMDADFDLLLDYIQKGNIKNALIYIVECAFLKLKNDIVYHNSIMYTCIGICIISGLISYFSSDIDGGVYNYITVSAICIPLISMYLHTYEIAVDVLSASTAFMQASLPVYFSVISTITNRLPLSVYAIFMGFISGFQWFGTNIALPCVSVTTVCCALENLNSEFNISSIKRIITNILHWALGLYTTVFISVLKLTQIVAYGTNKLVMNGVRYTLSRAVPVVGGFVSETAGAVISATLILHNSMGIAFVLIIVFATLLPSIALFGLSFLLRFSGALFNIVGGNKTADVMYGFGESIAEISVFLLCAGVTFILGIGIQLTVG